MTDFPPCRRITDFSRRAEERDMMMNRKLLLCCAFVVAAVGSQSALTGVAETDALMKQEATEPVSTLQLQTQKFGGLPEPALLRHMQPQLHNNYMQKSKSLRDNMTKALNYLDTLKSRPPRLQHLSAIEADIILDWSLLEAKLTPQETQFQSYQLMSHVVQDMQSVVAYWITAERMKRKLHSTAQESRANAQVVLAKVEKIKLALKQLDEMERLKQELNAEIPSEQALPNRPL